MPVHKVKTTKDGKTVTGYKWGTTGKIYTGPGAKAKATAQARAIYAQGYKKR